MAPLEAHQAVGAAGEAVSRIVAAGIGPGAIEMMDRLSIRAAEEATGVGYRLDAGAAVDPFAKASGARVLQDGPTETAKIKTQVESGNVTWDVIDSRGERGGGAGASWGMLSAPKSAARLVEGGGAGRC